VTLGIERIAALPADLATLERAARAEGFAFLDRGRREWEDGTNRFARPGEALFAARLDGRLVGIAGLNVDPYTDEDPPAGRLRHLYVLPDARRRGVARALVAAVLAAAGDAFPRVRLRTTNPDADRFYVALGFARVAHRASATHEIRTSPSARGVWRVRMEPTSTERGGASS
jgi:GNAT superfamily N-acetyltransferase